MTEIFLLRQIQEAEYDNRINEHKIRGAYQNFFFDKPLLFCFHVKVSLHLKKFNAILHVIGTE